MTTRNLAKINDIKQYLDDAIKTLVTKDVIKNQKSFINPKSVLKSQYLPTKFCL